VLWELKNCGTDVLRQWWGRESSKRLYAFFDVLGQILHTFEFRDKVRAPLLDREIDREIDR
jgi:hypothetical protein